MACDTVKKAEDLKYRMAVCVYSKGDGVELIAFDQKNSKRVRI